MVTPCMIRLLHVHLVCGDSFGVRISSGHYSRTSKETFASFVASLAKPLWSSMTSSCYRRKKRATRSLDLTRTTEHTPELKINTDRNYRTDRGLPSKSVPYWDIGLLKKFIGTWDEIHRENYHKYLIEAGVSHRTIRFLEKYKTWVSYSRDGDEWLFTMGFLDYSRTVKFKLGKKFYCDFIDGSPMKIVITQDGNRLVERQETYRKPTCVVYVIWEVKGDNMIQTTKFNDVTMLKIFTRR